MQHPFQCLVWVRPAEQRTINEPGKEGWWTPSPGFLLAACGPKLLSVDLYDGNIVSEWPWKHKVASETDGNGQLDGSERPTKKQKTSDATLSSPNVIKLSRTPDHKHAVAVTDDKYVRVFKVQEDGQLHELSQRCMPKRPCAIQVLPDNETILCGDKFGDVYSLPLLPEAVPSRDATAGALRESAQPETIFKPSATAQTVHSQRNLKALKAQQEQKNFTPKKEPLAFEHKLLLGHVSMLTDMIFAKRKVHGKDRSCIITADRDEHIRISRAPPQAHIIEGFCLGHQHFVSKLCKVPRENLVVSGGGDDWIGIWDWPSFTLRAKIDIKAELKKQSLSDKVKSKVQDLDHIAISGLWVAPLKIGTEHLPRPCIMVACENIPVIVAIPIAKSRAREGPVVDEMVYCFELDANPIDLANVGDHVVISLDARNVGQKRLQAFELKAKRDSTGRAMGIEHAELDMFGIDQYEPLESKLDKLNAVTGEEADEKKVDELLYGIEKMRKRAGHDDTGVDAPVGEGPVEQTGE